MSNLLASQANIAVAPSLEPLPQQAWVVDDGQAETDPPRPTPNHWYAHGFLTRVGETHLGSLSPRFETMLTSSVRREIENQIFRWSHGTVSVPASAHPSLAEHLRLPTTLPKVPEDLPYDWDELDAADEQELVWLDNLPLAPTPDPVMTTSVYFTLMAEEPPALPYEWEDELLDVGNESKGT